MLPTSITVTRTNEFVGRHHWFFDSFLLIVSGLRWLWLCMSVNVLVFSNTEYVRKMYSIVTTMVDQFKSTLVIFTHKKQIQFGTHQRHGFTS